MSEGKEKNQNEYIDLQTCFKSTCCLGMVNK